MVLSGNGHGFWLDRFGNPLLDDLGASFLSHSYLEQSGDDAFCVGLEAPMGGGALYGTEHSGGDYAYGAYGSGCPNVYGFEVFGAVGTGVGNRVYVDQGDGTETSFAQVVNHHSGPHTYSYRTVLNGTAWSLLAGLDEPGVCDISEAARVAAAHNEIRAAAEWIYGGEDLSALCEDPCLFNISDVDGGGGSVVSASTTRFHASAPNPFNPRTTLRFSLAMDGPASLAIFDVAGRQVRLVAEGMRTAGVHEVVWDGTDDRGQRLASGTYWARLSTGGRNFASRLVLLR
jgi:hypothetical protein